MNSGIGSCLINYHGDFPPKILPNQGPVTFPGTVFDFTPCPDERDPFPGRLHKTK